MLSVFRAALLCQGLWLVCDPLLAAHNPSQLFARLLITQTRIRPCNHESGRDRAATSRADSVHPSTQPRYSTLRPSRTCIVSAAQPLCVRNTTKSHRRTRSKLHFPKNRSDSCQINVATAKAHNSTAFENLRTAYTHQTHLDPEGISRHISHLERSWRSTCTRRLLPRSSQGAYSKPS